MFAQQPYGCIGNESACAAVAHARGDRTHACYDKESRHIDCFVSVRLLSTLHLSTRKSFVQVTNYLKLLTQITSNADYIVGPLSKISSSFVYAYANCLV